MIEKVRKEIAYFYDDLAKSKRKDFKKVSGDFDCNEKKHTQTCLEDTTKNIPH
jgi:hypothetical protein